MSDFEIPDKTAIGTVDGAADTLLIYDDSASALKKTTRNTLLNLTSAPVGLDDTQTLTNKTLTAPTVSSPVLSGTVTGTYTLGGTPTFPAAVVTLTGSQTLTNKTLTSPTINTATISNPTLTVDTISEHTLANGVNIDGLLIKDGTIPDSLITPAKLLTGTGSSWAWQSFVPSWTNLTPGSGTNNGYYIQVGKTVFFRTEFIYGAGSAVGTNPTLTLPVTASSNAMAAANALYTTVVHLNDATGNRYFGLLRYASTTTGLVIYLTSSSGLIDTGVTATAPFTWTTSDSIYISGSYEAA